MTTFQLTKETMQPIHFKNGGDRFIIQGLHEYINIVTKIKSHPFVSQRWKPFFFVFDMLK
jgi:hypothetical protein